MNAPRADAAGRQRLAALLLIGVQCATLACLEHGYVTATIAGGLGCLSLVGRLRIAPQRAPHWLWYALLGLALIGKYRLAPESLPEQLTFFNTVIGYEAARFLIFVQVLQLFIKRPDGRLPNWLAGLACLSMMFASNVRLNPGTQLQSQALSLAFMAALAGFAQANRLPGIGRHRGLVRGLLIVVLLAGGGAAVATASLLRRYEGVIEEWLADRAGGRREGQIAPGFGGRGAVGDISNWKLHMADHIALRIYAPTAPGYLRGRVADIFQGGVWADAPAHLVLNSVTVEHLRPLRKGEALFQLPPQPVPASPGSPIDIWPDDHPRSRLFLPLETAYLATGGGAVSLNTHGLAVRPELDAARPYTAFLARTPWPVELSPERRDVCLFVDDGLRRELEPLADEIFAEATTTADKLATVKRYFLENYRYDLRAPIVPRRRLIIDFLRERGSGHCELFATGGLLLLRLAGVPARYVTGYVATERNRSGGYWIARHRDAHAWIEAYDDVLQRWVTVECTPPAGVPASASAGGWSDWLDAQQQRWRRWKLQLTGDGIFGLLGSLLGLAASVPALAAVTLAIVAILAWKQRTDRASQRSRRRQVIDYPDLLRQLREGDRLARRLGCERQSHETLTAFARRLRVHAAGQSDPSTLADWYDAYVRVRYGKSPIGPDAARLAELLKDVTVRCRGR